MIVHAVYYLEEISLSQIVLFLSGILGYESMWWYVIPDRSLQGNRTSFCMPLELERIWCLDQGHFQKGGCLIALGLKLRFNLVEGDYSTTCQICAPKIGAHLDLT